jgi:hypothetical protein
MLASTSGFVVAKNPFEGAGDAGCPIGMYGARGVAEDGVWDAVGDGGGDEA